MSVLTILKQITFVILRNNWSLWADSVITELKTETEVGRTFTFGL